MQGSENIQETEAKGKVLESVVTERDLGVFVLSNDLTWSKQVFEQSCRANKLLGYISYRRNTGFTRSTGVRRSVYVT